MDREKKLLELLDVTSLKKYVEPTTYAELMETGTCYTDLFDKAFAKGEVHTDRIRNAVARLLAETLQPEARARYGVADERAIRRLVSETFEEYAREEWARLMGLLKEGIGREGLSPDQQVEFLGFMEGLRDPFIEQLCSEAAKLKLIDVGNINELSLAVAEMLKEDSHADEV
jgi:hypothetical protein